MNRTDQVVDAQLSGVSDALRRWLTTADVVSGDGAYVAWYDADQGVAAYAYPEITGYALTHLAGQRDLHEAEARCALRAAHWLVDRWDRGVHGARDGWDGEGVYQFDLAMIANGLLLAGTRWDLADGLRVGLEIAGQLAGDVFTYGVLRPLPADQPTTHRGWSAEGTAHMGKALQCLHHAALLGGPPELSTAITKLAAHVRDLQQDDGRFVTEPEDGVTMLHPHLYAVEGLWCHAQASGDAEAAQAARTGAAWALRQQLPSGGLPRSVSVRAAGEPPVEQLDLSCQALRAAVLTGIGSDAEHRVAERLAEVAVRLEGGCAALPYQPASEVRHLNTWASLFGCQALLLAAGRSMPVEEPMPAEEPMLDWRALV